MPSVVGENGFHTVTVESQSDDLQGDDVTIQYENGGTVVQGDTQVGVAKGSTMTFVTDFGGKSIDPGFWNFEFTRDDGGVTRQVGLKGDDDNQRFVEVTDAESI